ncbi:MAG TPA: hypothetical protein VGS27_29000 [Candidatus Sulfotelmatobacter sp.]|nr:hypothetical protein [Candidatus Sulfotelmatobacter sp.]
MSNQNGTCAHIKVTGVRCGSPALKGEQFCYFHQNAIRSVRRPKQSRLHPIALIEDEESIQYALMEVMNALMRNTIDLKRATLVLRALHIAVKNAGRVKFNIQGKSSVRQIPEFAPPPANTDLDETSEIDLPYNAFVPPKSERQVMEEKARARKLHEWQAQQAAIRENLERARITPRDTSEQTAAYIRQADAMLSRPAAPQPAASAGADATATNADTTPKPAPPATAVPPHNFKPAPTRSASTTRKPPQPVTIPPKERKHART